MAASWGFPLPPIHHHSPPFPSSKAPKSRRPIVAGRSARGERPQKAPEQPDSSEGRGRWRTGGRVLAAALGPARQWPRGAAGVTSPAPGLALGASWAPLH